MSPPQNNSHRHVSRRGFLAVGGVGIVGLTLGEATGAAPTSDRAVVQILLNGGASALETFDPKPDAPREVRGPLRSIDTAIPGVRFAECLPELSRRAADLVVLRSLRHDAAPIHESGLQILRTGGLVSDRRRRPPLGTLLEPLLGPGSSAPVALELGGPPAETGVYPVNRYFEAHSATESPSGLFDIQHRATDELTGILFDNAAASVHDSYGETRFGRLFWAAARLIDAGVRHLSVHTFDQLEGRPTWDSHGCSTIGPATVFDYRDSIGPQFDRAAGAFLDDLKTSGRLASTLLICTGEMGRAPRLNDTHGREHWTQVWSGFLAGGGLSGGQVIGASDKFCEEVQDHPIDLAQLPALGCEFLGIPPGTEVSLGPDLTFRTPESSLRVA